MKHFTDEDSLRNEVEQTMNSLDHIERADINPFFVSKVFTRIDSRKNVSAYNSAWFKVALASMIVIILINVYTILVNIKEDVAIEDSKVTFIEEYEIAKYQDEYSY
jgi:hypothetical protein